MSDLLTKVVPLALAAAVNPAGILVLVALLATAKRTALFLCVGFCAVFVAFGAVVLAFGLRLELRPSTTSALVDLAAAVLVAYLGVRFLRKHPEPDAAKKKRQLGPADAWAALVVFLVICLTPMVAPVVVAFAAPKASGKVLDPVNRTLTKHGDTIIAVVCFVIAVYLAEKGIRGL